MGATGRVANLSAGTSDDAASMATTKTPRAKQTSAIVQYPYSVGEAVAEGPRHVEAILYALATLRNRFAAAPFVQVGARRRPRTLRRKCWNTGGSTRPEPWWVGASREGQRMEGGVRTVLGYERLPRGLGGVIPSGVQGFEVRVDNRPGMEHLLRFQEPETDEDLLTFRELEEALTEAERQLGRQIAARRGAESEIARLKPGAEPGRAASHR